MRSYRHTDKKFILRPAIYILRLAMHIAALALYIAGRKIEKTSHTRKLFFPMSQTFLPDVGKFSSRCRPACPADVGFGFLRMSVSVSCGCRFWSFACPGLWRSLAELKPEAEVDERDVALEPAMVYAVVIALVGVEEACFGVGEPVGRQHVGTQHARHFPADAELPAEGERYAAISLMVEVPVAPAFGIGALLIVQIADAQREEGRLIAPAPEVAQHEFGTGEVHVHLVLPGRRAQVVVLHSRGKVGAEVVASFRRQAVARTVAVLAEEVVAVAVHGRQCQAAADAEAVCLRKAFGGLCVQVRSAPGEQTE